MISCFASASRSLHQTVFVCLSLCLLRVVPFLNRSRPPRTQVSLSEALFSTMYELWRVEAPILELT